MNSYSDILNNELIINSLKVAVKNGRVNHAYIFDGEKGIGKTSLAKAFAKTLNCEKGGEEACGECTSCRTFDDGNNPDIFYIENWTMTFDIKIMLMTVFKGFINKNAY